MKKPIKFCKNPDCGDEILDYKSSKREYVPVSMLDLNKTVQMSPEPFIKKKHHE